MEKYNNPAFNLKGNWIKNKYILNKGLFIIYLIPIILNTHRRLFLIYIL